jgi:hypothetical protein
MLSKPRFLLACTLSLLAIAAPVQTINVPADQPTIQAAINAATTGATVLVAPGTYYENINFLGKYITVTSSGGAAVTIIDGSKGQAPAVTVAPGATEPSYPPPMVLNGFTIQNGGSEPSSSPTGGIFVTELALTITNNILTHNHCAGIWSVSFISSPTIQGNEIDNTLDNHGDCPSGGGRAIVVARFGAVAVNPRFYPVTITGNTIQNNTQGGQEGIGSGAVTILIGSVGAEIQNNILRNNSTAAIGGGLDLASSNVVVSQNVIYANHAACGGGIATNRTSLYSDLGTLILASDTSSTTPLAAAPRPVQGTPASFCSAMTACQPTPP